MNLDKDKEVIYQNEPCTPIWETAYEGFISIIQGGKKFVTFICRLRN